MRFVIDKSSPVGFVDQLVASIRRAIERRELKAGDLLPGFRQIAAELDVSLRVPRDAVARLVKEGVLSARRGFGTTVVGKGGPVRPRRVLVLTVRWRKSEGKPVVEVELPDGWRMTGLR